MIWTPLDNGKCRRGEAHYKFTKVDSCMDVKLALDERGLVFAWGCWYDGMTGFISQTEYASGVGETAVPTLVPIGDGFVDIFGGEYTCFALHSSGRLMGWGNDTFNGANFCRTTAPPNTIFWFPVEVTPGWRWKKVCTNWYTMFAIGLDDYLYTWGSNYLGYMGCGPLFSQVSLYRTPFKHPLISEKVKYISGDLFTMIVVTESDKVYFWGEIAEDTGPGIDMTTPVSIPVTLPPGVTIVGCAAGWSCATVLDSDGFIWAIGDYAGELFPFDTPEYNAGGWADEWKKITQFIADDYSYIPARKIVSCKIEDGQAFAAIDEHGTLWKSGAYADYANGRVEPMCDVAYGGFMLCGAEVEGHRKWVDAQISSFNHNHLGVTEDGRLWTWGHNECGKLGYGLREIQWHGNSCIPQLASPAVNLLGETMGLNIERGVGLDPYDKPPKQDPEHDPCGHWHLQVEEEVCPCNCWYMALDVAESSDNNKVYLVAHGEYFPWQMYHYLYDPSENIWTLLNLHEAAEGVAFTRSGSSPGQAKRIGSFRAFYNGMIMATGSPPDPTLNVLYGASGMALWAYDGANVNYHENLAALYEDGYRKMGIATGGLIAYICLEGATIKVYVSTDYGVTFVQRATYSNVGVLDYQLCVYENGTIMYMVLKNSGALYTWTSTNQGVSWSTGWTGSIPLSNPLKAALNSIANLYTIVMSKIIHPTLDYYKSVGRTWYKWPGEVGQQPGTFQTNTVLFDLSMTGNNVVFVADGKIFWTPDAITTDMAESYTPDNLMDETGALAANSTGVFVFSQFAYSDPVSSQLQILLSEDQGEHWTARITPLNQQILPGEERDLCDSISRLARDRAWVAGVTKWVRSAPTSREVVPDEVSGGPKIVLPKYGGDNDVDGC